MQPPIIDDKLFKYLLDGVKDYAIFALDPGGLIASWNAGAERIKGYKPEEIIGKHFSVFYTEEAKAKKHPEYELAQALELESYEEEGWRVRKGGGLFRAHVTISTLYDERGQHIGFAKVTRDLSERQKATAEAAHSAGALEASEKTFNLMISAVKDYAIFSLSPEGIIQSWNKGAQRIKGYTAAEAIGQHFSIFYTQSAKDIKHPEYELAQAIENGSYEEEGWRVRKDGNKIWVSVTITPVRDETGTLQGFVKVTRDLTERQAAQSAAMQSAQILEERENAFNKMIAAVKDYAIFSLSPEGIIQSWNAGAERIKGYKADEIIGKHFSIFYTQEAKDARHPQYELAQAIKDGSYEEEGWRVRKDGNQIWVSVTITPVVLQSGALKGFVKVTRDLTERKRYEMALEAARDDALLANALKSKFVANVTHEIRTPLSGVVGLSQLLAEDPDLDEETHNTGKLIFEESKRLLIILNDLLDFAKLEAGKMQCEHIPYAVTKVIDDVVTLARTRANEKGLAITVTIDPKVPNTWVGDPNKLRQVLHNLVHNAIKFTEYGGIELFVEEQDQSLFFSVADTGIGISPETQDKLFKPFVQAHESTTRIFGGTGLGLAIAQQLVELMGGTIGLTSTPGQGTTIWFNLPLRPSALEHNYEQA